MNVLSTEGTSGNQVTVHPHTREHCVSGSGVRHAGFDVSQAPTLLPTAWREGQWIQMATYYEYRSPNRAGQL